MGGGGSYYDRDVSVGPKSSAGITSFAQSEMSRTELCKDLLPLNRRLVSTAKYVLGICFDVTGSMGNEPRLFMDKMPNIAGQIAMQKYLKDKPQVSLSAVGDVIGDRGPLQICDFVEIKSLDPWLRKIWIEGQGGSGHYESYEFMAYFYAYLYDMKNAALPMFIFFGDESFRKTIPSSELRKHFGGQHESIEIKKVFEDLRKKFNNNVFLVHRRYDAWGLDSEIVSDWEDVLGKGHVVQLPEDPAIADMILGIIALVSGSRTLKGYVKDMETRPLKMGGKTYKPQTKERIEMVENALKPLEAILLEEGRLRTGNNDNKQTTTERKSKPKKTKPTLKV